MDRREFMATGGVATLGAGFFGACRTLGGPDLEALGESDLPQFLAQVREQVRVLRTPRADGPLRDYARKWGLREDVLEHSSAAAFVTSTFRDLPPRLQRDPQVQRWLLEEAPSVSRSVFEMTELFQVLPRDERERLGQALRADPSLAQELSGIVVAKTALRGVPTERVDQTRQVVDQVYWRLANQDPSAFFDDYLDKADRLCRRNGVDRQDWRAQMDAADADLQFALRAEQSGGSETYIDSHPVVKVGLIMLGIGGAVAITGAVLLAVAGEAVGVITIGALALLGGLAVVVAGGILVLIGVLIGPR